MRKDSKQIRLLSHSIRLEEAPNSAIARSVASSISIMIFVFIVWASIAEIEETAKASGEIIPENYIHSIQHVDGGIIKSIHTEENEKVDKGQRLITLEEISIREELAQIKEKRRYLEIEVEYISQLLGLTKKKVDLPLEDDKLFTKRLLRENKKLSSAKEILKIKEDLSKRGLISKLSVLETRKEVNETVSQLYEKLISTKSELIQIEEEIKIAYKKLDNLEIFAPITGLVKGLKYNNPGNVVPPGATIMEIVPIDEELVAEVKILPKDIGFIDAGMKALVKVSTYDFSRYGAIAGSISSISATTFKDKNGDVYYKGKLKLDKNFVGDKPSENIVLPGMIIDVDIITGNRTIMSYLLNPIKATITSSLHER